MSTLFIIDIDGTLANGARRFREAGSEPSRDNRKAYDKWLSNVQNTESLAKDPVVSGMVELCCSLWLSVRARIAFVTSREESYRDVTWEWLGDQGFFLNQEALIMRPTGDYSEGSELKERIIEKLLKSSQCDNVVVIDDDEHGKLETVCKQRGWTFLKACSGGNGTIK